MGLTRTDSPSQLQNPRRSARGVIAAVVENMRRNLEPLRYSTLAPSPTVYLHHEHAPRRDRPILQGGRALAELDRLNRRSLVRRLFDRPAGQVEVCSASADWQVEFCRRTARRTKATCWSPELVLPARLGVGGARRRPPSPGSGDGGINGEPDVGVAAPLSFYHSRTSPAITFTRWSEIRHGGPARHRVPVDVRIGVSRCVAGAIPAGNPASMRSSHRSQLAGHDAVGGACRGFASRRNPSAPRRRCAARRESAGRHRLPRFWLDMAWLLWARFPVLVLLARPRLRIWLRSPRRAVRASWSSRLSTGDIPGCCVGSTDRFRRRRARAFVVDGVGAARRPRSRGVQMRARVSSETGTLPVASAGPSPSRTEIRVSSAPNGADGVAHGRGRRGTRDCRPRRRHAALRLLQRDRRRRAITRGRRARDARALGSPKPCGTPAQRGLSRRRPRRTRLSISFITFFRIPFRRTRRCRAAAMACRPGRFDDHHPEVVTRTWRGGRRIRPCSGRRDAGAGRVTAVCVEE